MYHGFRSKKRDGMDMVWEFFDRERTPDDPNEPYAEIRIGPFADEAQYAKFYPEIVRLADESWAQGRASEADEHRTDTEQIEGYRKQNHERWLQICALQDQFRAVVKLATDAWLSNRMIAPEEIRDALQEKKGG